MNVNAADKSAAAAWRAQPLGIEGGTSMGDARRSANARHVAANGLTLSYIVRRTTLLGVPSEEGNIHT